MTRDLLCATAFFLLAAASPGAEKMKAEELVEKHLQAVSPDPGRFGPRVVRGACVLSGRQVGTGRLAGRYSLTAAPPYSRTVLDFGTNDYGAEVFAFDGQGVEVGFANKQVGQRSALARFVAANEVIVRDGLFGGVLNGSWPLAALAERGAKVSYEGLKKLDDRELHRVKYRAKKDQGDLQVVLYFEPETFRHVATVYSDSHTQSMVGDPTQSSQQSDTYYRLEERFADFASSAGLALPSKWTVRYEVSSRTTGEWKYEMAVEQVEKK